MSRFFPSHVLFSGLPVAFVFITTAYAGDWPQILGPNRNGQAVGETLSRSWPEDGPQQLWAQGIGEGYAGPAIAEGRVVAFHRNGGVERIEAFDLATGKSLWKADFDAAYRGGINPDTGPRCVPLIHEGFVYAYGAAGDLHCVSFKDGAKKWSRALYDDYSGSEGYFGAGSTPIIVGGRLLLNIGGRDGSGIVAVDRATGKTVWKATDEDASYSSPTAAMIDGKEIAIFVTRSNTIAIDPTAGKTLWVFPFGKRGPTVNAATPLVIGDKLFVTASYGIGSQMATFTESGAKPVWENADGFASQYATPVIHDGFIYGTDGREDVGVARFVCLDAATGKEKWSRDRFGVAHTLLIDDLLLTLNTEGEARLLQASPTGYKPLANASLTEGTTRAIPAISNGRFLFRTNDGRGGKLMCVKVGE